MIHSVHGNTWELLHSFIHLPVCVCVCVYTYRRAINAWKSQHALLPPGTLYRTHWGMNTDAKRQIWTTQVTHKRPHPHFAALLLYAWLSPLLSDSPLDVQRPSPSPVSVVSVCVSPGLICCLELSRLNKSQKWLCYSVLLSEAPPGMRRPRWQGHTF